jgi:predicted DCC family thiol-disulfide oxidoreductase YuxK
MQKLFVLYDMNCDFCRRCRRWMEEEPAFLPVQFVAAQSDDARRLLPDWEKYKVTNELTVLGDDGALYQGPHAFIMCLYALVEFRELSLRLASPTLLPFARQIFHFVSNNRVAISKWLRSSSDHNWQPHWRNIRRRFVEMRISLA